MRKIYLSLLFFGLTFIVKAQNPSVEKSMYGVQTGFLGIWAHNESRLSNSIALRTEIGFDTGFWGGDFYDKMGFILTPVINLEPRVYYNLNKRVKNSRHIDGNSGNFLSIKATYHPDWFVISNTQDLRIISDISVIPTWGIRRTLWYYVAYEAGIGVGYRYILAKQAGFVANESEVAVNLHLKIGFRF